MQHSVGYMLEETSCHNVLDYVANADQTLSAGHMLYPSDCQMTKNQMLVAVQVLLVHSPGRTPHYMPI